MQQISRFVLVVCVLGLIGCGGADGPKTVTVSGEVTFDGKPLPAGEIIFRDDGGEGHADAGKIRAGEYSFQCTLGKKTVEISAMREVPGTVPQALETGEAGGEVEQYIPEKYNGRTTLGAEVTESGENTFDFPLEAK